MTVNKRTITLGAFSILWLGLVTTSSLLADPVPTPRAPHPTPQTAIEYSENSHEGLVPRLIPSTVADSPLSQIPVLVPGMDARVAVRDIVIDEEALVPPQDWAPRQEKVLREMQPVLAELEGEIERLRAKFSEVEFSEMVERNEVTVKMAGVGKAQLNRVKGRDDSDDKAFFVRAVHYETELALLYLDKNQIDPDSRHLKRITARQRLYSGIVDERGKKSGRDVVEIWQDGSHTLKDPILETKYEPRHLPGSGDWWKDFWAHLYDGKRTASHKFMMVYGTGMQVGLLGAVGYAKMQMGMDDHFNYAPLAITLGYGALLGLYNDIYKGLTTEGSDANRATKMSMVSVFHTYTYAFWDSGVWTVLRIWDKAAIFLHTQLWMNIVVGKIGRVPWSELPKIREWQRENPKPISFRLGGEIDVLGKKFQWGMQKALEINRAQFEAQTFYIVPFVLSWLGRAGFSSHEPNSSSISLDAGDLLMIGTIPIANALVWGYGKWKNFPKEPELRKKMFKSMRMLMIYPIPGMAYRWIKSYGKELYTDMIPLWRRTASEVVIPAAKRQCSSVLAKLKFAN